MSKDLHRDTDNTSAQEMEQIQKGLEEFLNREVLNRAAVQTDIGDEEMEDRNDNGRSTRTEPQFFTIGEEEEQEKELDIIGVQNGKGGTRPRRRISEDYVEDWDSRERPGRVRETDESSGGRKQSGKKQSGKKQSGKKQSEKGQSKKNLKEQEDMQDKKRSSRKVKKKKKSKLKRILITIVVILVLLCAGLYYLVGSIYGKMNYEKIDSVSTEPLKNDGVVNVLLIGNDSRENGEDGRSDAMILVSISDKTKTIYMTSLLRDMYVEIPGYKNNRLNAAYSFGGAELLMETVEQNLDIDVNHYVLVNFEAFANLVDAVGGVDLELTSEEIEYVNGYLVEYNMLTNRPQGTDNMDPSLSGLVHLNGPQALAYSRNRYLGTDFGRTERQRKVLEAVIKDLPKSLVTNPKELIDGLMPNLTTNLTQNEIFQLSLVAPKILTYDIVQSSIPIEGSYKNATIRDMAVLEVDFEANKQYLKEKIYGEEAPAQE